VTQHNDPFRTGLYASETQLTWNSVQTDFGKLFSVPVDGRVYAQPLFMPAVLTFSGRHDLVIVATENNSVYAFDAHSGATIWQHSCSSPTLGMAISSLDAYDSQFDNIPGTIGITGTPVIDPATNTIYLVNAAKKSDGSYHQYFNALDVASGAPRANSPQEITASFQGDGEAAPAGVIYFDPLRENQRAGLLQLNNKIYVAWSSHGDDYIDVLHGKTAIFFGWIMSFDSTTLKVVDVFNTSPHASPYKTGEPYGGSIWGGGAGLASDGNKIYLNTGNGLFDPADGNWPDSTLAFSPTLSVVDSFTPSDQVILDRYDMDFASGGVIIVPTSTVPQHSNLLVTTGKEGTIFVLDRDHLGGTQVASDVPGRDTICPPNQAATGCVVAKHYQAVGMVGYNLFFGLPAYFNDTLYFAGNGDTLKSFALGGTQGISVSPVHQTSTLFNYPGATPSISSNVDSSDAIVWALERTQPQQDNPPLTPIPTYLHAYYANSLAEIYNSHTQGEDPEGVNQFVPPTIAGGQVFVATTSSLVVYGLFVTGAPASQSVIQGNATTYAISTGATGSPLTLSASGLPAGATPSFSPATVPSGGTSTLTIATATTTPVGTYPITITSTGNGGATHSTTVSLVVLKRHVAPTPAFTFKCIGRQCTFDGTSSKDDSGNPVSAYSWSFGDNSAAVTTGTAAHTYAANNSYTVTLTVTDSAGLTASVTHTVSAVDQLPKAAFAFSCAIHQCSFDASGSSDTEGPIYSYVWSFGDGTTDTNGNDVRVSHVYAVNGTYTVTLTVTDSVGQTSSVMHNVSAIDQPPHAAFSTVCSDKKCTVEAEASSDDVAIVQFTWSWGDGQGSIGGSPMSLTSHTYANYGTYTITLTVTDTAGQTGTASQTVVLRVGPQASFTYSCAGRSCTFNASASTGPVAITNYHWDFDDETTLDTAQATAVHVYAYGAIFRVGLTVTDSNGVTNTITLPVTVQ
jgi:PKD repeat protein